MTTREQIYSALFALVSAGEGLGGSAAMVGAGGETLLYTSRRVKEFSELRSQPALCQAEHDEQYAQVTRLPTKRTLSASWILYHKPGVSGVTIPATTTNHFLDAIDALLPSHDPDQVQTLGGLVQWVKISGRVFKAQGDLDGQALIVVPILILIP